mmetsp:Transcript_21202/g.37545  ORF Transcript_21202/g.37545 Transcript_21202/m.37545 type:complete len:292 (+) Transcript_21202:622-1497(+)
MGERRLAGYAAITTNVLRLGRSGLYAVSGGTGKVTKVSLSKVNEYVVLDASCAENHARSSVMSCHKRFEVFYTKLLQVASGAPERASKGSLVSVSSRMKHLGKESLCVGLHVLELVANSLALLINVPGSKLGVLDGVGEELNSLGSVFAKELALVDSEFTSACGAKLSTNVLNIAHEAKGRSGFGRLEGHVLEQVANTRVCVGLVPGAGVHKHTESSYRSVVILASNTEPVVESGDLGHRLLVRRSRSKGRHAGHLDVEGRLRGHSSDSSGTDGPLGLRNRAYGSLHHLWI